VTPTPIPTPPPTPSFEWDVDGVLLELELVVEYWVLALEILAGVVVVCKAIVASAGPALVVHGARFGISAEFQTTTMGS
jgi:hypothetical protein